MIDLIPLFENNSTSIVIDRLDFNTDSNIQISTVTWPYSGARVKGWTLGKVLLVENIIDTRPDRKKRTCPK